jgi:hypothetical protein
MITDQLWGGILESLELDAPMQTVSLGISVSGGGMLSSFQLRLSGVAEFHFVNGIDGPWD